MKRTKYIMVGRGNGKSQHTYEQIEAWVKRGYKIRLLN